MTIRFVPYKDINPQKWDECVACSHNGLIYCTTEYLDAMAANWDAVILNDYEAIMPLTWKKKILIKYLYQPAFFQQGGIISTTEITEEMVLLFLETAFAHFSFAEITLNFNNPISEDNPYFKGRRNNFIFELKENATADLDDYILKRVRRASKNKVSYQRHENIPEIISLYKTLYHKRLPSFKEEDFSRFENYCEKNKNKLVIRKIVCRNEIVAAVLLLKDNKRLYNIISCILPEGKTLLANYFLYYELINEFQGTNMILDFEGSDQHGIAYFYNKFATENQTYPFIKMNRLPAPLQLIKR